jgi:predicted esterase
VTIVHGEKDALVPYAHALFARDVLTRASVTMEVDPEWNHFIPWNQFSMLKESLLQSR